MTARRIVGTLVRVLVVLTFGVVLAPQVAAQATTPQEKPVPTAQVAGKWQVSLEMEVGTASVVMVFKQDGEKLAGTYTGRYGEYPLAGTVKGRALDFVVTINAEGTETKMHFIGELDAAGAVIKGSADLGGMGEAGWIAKKATEVS
jgi:hypothetical protein